MTPREKASELVDKFSNKCLLTTDGGKVAALIAVNEIIDAYAYLEVEILHTQFGEILNKINGEIRIKYTEFCMYWEQVKKEIDKL
jgi:hypothetical protein